MGEACIFGKWFIKKLGVNHFSNFNKGFFSERKLFFVWPPFFRVKQTPTNLKIFFGKYITVKQTEPKRKIFSFALSHFPVSMWYQNQKNILSFFIFWKGKKRIKTKALIIWVNYFWIYVGFPWVKFIHF